MSKHCFTALVAGLVILGHLPRCRSDDRLPGIVFVGDDIFGPKYEWPGVARPGTAH